MPGPDGGAGEARGPMPMEEVEYREEQLRQLQHDVGALRDEKHGWVMPFYTAEHAVEYLPIPEWKEKRRAAAQRLRELDDGCPHEYEGHCDKPEPGDSLLDAEEEFLREEAEAKAKKAREDAFAQGLGDVLDQEKMDREFRQGRREIEGAEDNWKHCGARMKCQTCMFYVPKAQTFVESVDHPQIGRCRERSPTIKGWPAVYPGDWCGAHKIDETKL